MNAQHTPGRNPASEGEIEYALHLESAVNVGPTERQDDPLAAVLRLDTFRPVWLLRGATMHRDVIPNDAGWIRREDVIAAIAKATGSAR